jgi:GGDEF domain-containing protein
VPGVEQHDRRYLQGRVLEEIDRHRRHGHEFSLLVFEARPVSDGIPVRRKIDVAIEILRASLRPSDVAVRAFEDVIAVLLVETDSHGAADTLFRLRGRLARLGGTTWHIDTYTYPADARAINELSLLTAA